MLAALLWKFKAPLIGFGVAVLLALGGYVWLEHHDSVLLSGYVKQVELTAANAKLQTEAKRADAAQAALDAFRKKSESEAAAAQINSANLENEIDAYEKKLAALGDQCRISHDDLDWLSNH